MKLPNVLNVEVTEGDIKNGRKNSENASPLAKAIRRTLGLEHEKVTTDVYIEVGRKAVEYQWTNKAAEWLFHFDEGKPVKPTKFQFKKL